MNPVIRYQGREVMVTPDTAAELVGSGEAELVKGTLPKPRKAKPAATGDAEAPAEAAPKKTTKAKPRRSRGKKAE